MLKNYLTVAFRNLTKHKFYSFLNIVGLSVGLCSFILITQYVKDELSYDQYNEDLEQIYRMDFDGTINGNRFNTALASAPAAKTMLADYPEVEDAFRFRTTGNWFIKRENSDASFKEEKAIFADANFFSFFSIPLLNGDPATCLEKPNTLVLSENLAKKIFGNDNPVGQTLTLDNTDKYEVTGVFQNIPNNSHFHYEMMLSMESREESKSTFWMSFNFNTYLKLTPGTDPASLEAKFPDLIVKYIGPEIEKFMGLDLTEFSESGNNAAFYLYPLEDIHLKSDKLGELEPNGDINYVYLFTAIALFILILACINFMNLSTARSANRAKEVGIRKVMGAYKGNLVNQFLSEAFIISFISTAIAIGLAFLTLPMFNDLAKKSISYSELYAPSFLLAALVIAIVVGLMAGSYPAFYLSNFRPIAVLKGKLNLGTKSGGIRSTLVVVQFTVSIIMIIGTAIVFDQLSYIQNKKLGFNKDQIIMVQDAWLMRDKIESFKNELLNETSITHGTIASFLPVGTTNNNNVWFPGTAPTNDQTHVFHNYRIDHNYIETLGIEIIDGRDFSKEFPSDSTALLINEAAAKQLGFENPVGEKLSTYGGDNDEPVVETYRVVGVVKDFHYASLRENIDPLIFQLGRSRGFVSFKVAGDDIKGTIETIKAKWNEFAPGQPFSYSFLDDRFNDMYETEQQIGEIFSVFAFLAIFIACLGLYGLASFTTEQKTKEIGIRKVLGASIQSIVTLLSKEFIKLVIISFVIAAGVTFYFMRLWLDDFAYRTDLNPGTFILAGLLALVIAWLTMGIQSYRAARMNPARSLRDE